MFKITDKDKIIKPLEKDNKSNIMKFLKTLRPDGFFFNIIQGFFSKMGISDTLGVYQGQFFAFESKSKIGKPTPLQKVFLRMVTMAGGIAGVVKCVADVKQLFNISKAPFGIVGGSRNNHGSMLAKIYLKFCTPEQALKILNNWNEKNRPPLPKKEIRQIINQPMK